MGILRKLAPYVVAAASFLPLGGCPKDCKSTTGPYNPPPLIIQPKQADTQNPIGRSQDNQDPIPIVQEDGDYKTVSTSRKVRTEDGSVFTLNLQVHGPRQVRKRENAIYTATAEKISVGSIAIGAAVPNGDASFLPDGGSFKRMPPNGDYVASGDARYPFDKFAESLPGYQELGEKYRGDLKNISDIGRDRLLSELTPNLPIWFSDKKFTQSDLSLFTRRGSIGFSGAKQEIVCPAERDTQLKVFAFVNPWMSPDNVLLTTEFPIDVIDDVEPTKPKQEPPVSTLVGKDALLEYAKLAISPTNDRVSFSARQMDRLGHYLQGVLGTINLDSKTPTTTTCEGEPKLLSWSPDGRLIHSGYGLIWFAGVENGSDTRVSAKYPTGIAKSLAWSPGNRILYSQDLLAGERRIQRDIFSMDPETGETVNLTNTPDTDERNPIWSPDMQRISFLSSRTVVENNRSRNITEIFLMDKDGSNRRSLTDNQYMKKRLGGWVQDGIWFIETGGDNFWHEVSIISPNTSGGYKQIYSDGEFFREGE
ncbi:MAG TPA: hypothetical protein VJA47_04400, partial [archaeon]|nr:hypothetical protein [archaeon]